jgi:hypothetical protein
MGTSINTTPNLSNPESLWGDRSRDLFIDSMVKSAAVLDRFTLIDGVKNKVNVPIFDVTASAFQVGDDCEFSDNNTAAITEKEMSVQTYSWNFKNCKDVLEKSYRGIALKKGQHNPETMDVEFRNWVFDYFAKLASQKALTVASANLITEMDGDTDVNELDHNLTLDSSNILATMEDAYEAMSEVMLSAVYGDADREYRPAFFLGTNTYQMYQIAIANKHTTTPDGIKAGELPTYFGMEVIHFPSLADNKFFISAPTNLVMLTDDYNDVAAIDSEYEAKENAEYIWGRFKVGFSYLKGEEIVLAHNPA